MYVREKQVSILQFSEDCFRDFNSASYFVYLIFEKRDKLISSKDYLISYKLLRLLLWTCDVWSSTVQLGRETLGTRIPWFQPPRTHKKGRRVGVMSRVAQWWEHSLPTVVAWVRVLMSTLRLSYVVSCLCFKRFFLGCCGFPLPSKTNISKFQFGSGNNLVPRVLSFPSSGDQVGEDPGNEDDLESKS